MSEYQALKMTQRPGSPPFYLISAPAAQILEWCDVPRGKSDYLAGYQRALSTTRTGDISSYLRKSPANIIPGAIIIAVDPDYLEVDKDGPNGPCQISIKPDSRSFNEKLQELWGTLTPRLSDDELASTGAVVISDDDPDSDDESTQPPSYLAVLAKELNDAVTDFENLPQDRQEAITNFITDVSKPGLIIDGQHRVFGAKDYSEETVHLPVVLIPGISTAEQVFQFYILNSKSKPLKPTELRRIISTSLSNSEIDALYDRFATAGVDAEESRWTHAMNTEAESPFKGLIDFGYGHDGAVIPENVADQLIKGFMKMPRSRYSQLIDPLGADWTDTGERIKKFFAFWRAIRDAYKKAWEDALAQAQQGQKAQLFQKVALLTLQSFTLDRIINGLPFLKDGDPAPLSSAPEIKKMVNAVLKQLPQEFFTREWKLKQADTVAGRKEIYNAMATVHGNAGKLHGNMKLFQG